jgi:hypothetical protein
MCSRLSASRREAFALDMIGVQLRVRAVLEPKLDCLTHAATIPSAIAMRSPIQRMTGTAMLLPSER